MKKILFSFGILLLACCTYNGQSSKELNEQKVGIVGTTSVYTANVGFQQELKEEYLEYLASKNWIGFPNDKLMMDFYSTREGLNYVPDTLFKRLIGVSKKDLKSAVITARLFLKEKDFIVGAFRIVDSLNIREIYTIYNVQTYQLVDSYIIETEIISYNQIYVIAKIERYSDKLLLNFIEPTSRAKRAWMVKSPFFQQELKLTKNGFVHIANY